MSNIFVDDKGEGFPFVLVHGYLGSSEMWCFQKDYDLIGVGHTSTHTAQPLQWS
jgi:pimeloyl-ACP methyl ester carboxylesterase